MTKKYDDLYQTALLVTNRMTPSVSTLENLRELGIETDDATEAILTGIGMLALAQKAGFPLSDFEGEMPTVCPPETKAYISPKAAKYVEDVLNKKLPVFAYLHTTFLNLAAQCTVLNNKIATIDLLPKLLEVSPQLDDFQILGERGLWLAAQNPEWQNVFLKNTAPQKLHSSEAKTIEILRGIPLKNTPHLYNQVFDLMQKVGLVADNAARVALFWSAFLEEMER